MHNIGWQLTVYAFCEISESEVTKKLLGIAKPHECTKLLKSAFVVNVIRSDLVYELEAHDQKQKLQLFKQVATLWKF
jgi:hypothetical protein